MLTIQKQLTAHSYIKIVQDVCYGADLSLYVLSCLCHFFYCIYFLTIAMSPYVWVDLIFVLTLCLVNPLTWLKLLRHGRTMVRRYLWNSKSLYLCSLDWDSENFTKMYEIVKTVTWHTEYQSSHKPSRASLRWTIHHGLPKYGIHHSPTVTY